MTRYLLAVSAVAILAAAPASAQDNSSTQAGSTTTQQAAGSGSATQGMSANDVTCREITAMDTQTVAGVLYFISGYTNAQRDAGMSGDQSAGAMPSGGQTGSAADAATGATSGSDATGTSGAASGTGTDTAAAAGTGTSGATGGSATGASEGSGTTTTADAGAAGSGASGSADSGMTPQIAAMRGFFEIPIEQTVVACQAEPDSRAGDVIERQRGAGMGSSGGSTTNQ